MFLGKDSSQNNRAAFGTLNMRVILCHIIDWTINRTSVQRSQTHAGSLHILSRRKICTDGNRIDDGYPPYDSPKFIIGTTSIRTIISNIPIQRKFSNGHYPEEEIEALNNGIPLNINNSYAIRINIVHSHLQYTSNSSEGTSSAQICAASLQLAGEQDSIPEKPSSSHYDTSQNKCSAKQSEAQGHESNRSNKSMKI